MNPSIFFKLIEKKKLINFKEYRNQYLINIYLYLLFMSNHRTLIQCLTQKILL